MSKDTYEKMTVEDTVEKELMDILTGGKKEEEEKEPEVDMPKDRTFEQTSPAVDPSLLLNPANHAMEGVLVTEEEFEQLFESILHDKPLQMVIELGKLNVTVRSRTVYEQTLALEATADLLKEEGVIKDPLLHLQRFSMTFGLVSMNGTAIDGLVFEEKPNDPDRRNEDKEKLRRVTDKLFSNISYPRWQALLTAFNIFSYKEKLLLEGIARKENFTHAAD